MKLQKRTKLRSAALLNREKFSFAGFFSTETLGFFGNFAQRALNRKKWAKSPFFTTQKIGGFKIAKKAASRMFLSTKGRLPFHSKPCFAQPCSFPQCANVKGIFTDDNSTASATPPPDPSQCEAEAQEQSLSFAGGDGTEDTPFEVSSAEQLENIGQLLYCNFRLTQNIDLSGSGNWTPLGAESPCDGGNGDACFQGKLDGRNYMISGLTVNITEDYGGLFGYTGEHAEIRNVGLRGLSVTAGAETGGLVGYNGGSISNSYTTGAVSSGAAVIAGLVGNNNGTISSSYSTATVTGDGSVGGLVGDNALIGIISNSYAAGMVTGDVILVVGGLVGNNDGSISNSYATGTVSSNNSRVGGLVGWHFGSISNSYAAGLASSSIGKRVGGLIGQNDNHSSISGINYFASGTEQDSSGTTPMALDGVGHSSACDAAVCVQATGGNDTARATWLADTLDETDDGGLNWDAQLDAEGNAVWGNLNMSGFPCLKDMPAGARACP